MKKVIFVAALLVVAFSNANAQFGKFKPAEWQQYMDKQTGVTLTVLTDTLSQDSYIYQTDPMWTPDCKYLLFRSSVRADEPTTERTLPDGRKVGYAPTQYFMVEVATGRIIQITEGRVGSVYIANRSNKAFFNKMEGENDQNRIWSLYVLDLDKLFSDANRYPDKARKMDDYSKKLGTFPADVDDMGRPGGWCVNSEDEYAFISVTRRGTEEERQAMEAKAFKPRDDQPKKVGPSLSGLRAMNLRTGEVTRICDVDFRVGHIQCSRFKPNEIVFCLETGGDADQRMWYCNFFTKEYKPLYKETPLDWVTHETFGTQDYVYFNVLGWQDRLRKQASGIFRINLRTDDVDCLGNVEMDQDRSSSLTGRGFWHCNSSRDNQWAVGDTFAGSIWIINVKNGLKYQIASDVKMAPDHAHPFFSPDGTKLCFQSGHFTNGKRLNLVMVDLTTIPVFNQYNDK
jgi:oligogalacturonide lyase